VIREVQARVVAHQQRRRLVHAAKKVYPVDWTEGFTAITVQLPEGVRAHFDAPLEWPRSGAHLSLLSLQPTAEGSEEEVLQLFQRVHQQMVPKERQLGSIGLVPFVDAIRATLKAEVQALA